MLFFFPGTSNFTKVTFIYNFILTCHWNLSFKFLSFSLNNTSAMVFLFVLATSWQNDCWHNIEIRNCLLYLVCLYVIKQMNRHANLEAVLMFRLIACVVLSTVFITPWCFSETQLKSTSTNALEEKSPNRIPIPGEKWQKIDLILFATCYSAVEWLYMGLISFSDSTQRRRISIQYFKNCSDLTLDPYIYVTDHLYKTLFQT